MTNRPWGKPPTPDHTAVATETLADINADWFEHQADSPLGPLRAVAVHQGDNIALRALLWPNHPDGLVPVPPAPAQPTPASTATETPAVNTLWGRLDQQLAEYFDGSRQTFDLPLYHPGTEFQNEAWRALTQIPYGETRTYGQQARMIDRPKAVRAIGAANGKNPISILVPCHRVIGADGSLTGFAGGVETKAWLLEHERRQLLRRPETRTVR